MIVTKQIYYWIKHLLHAKGHVLILDRFKNLQGGGGFNEYGKKFCYCKKMVTWPFSLSVCAIIGVGDVAEMHFVWRRLGDHRSWWTQLLCFFWWALAGLASPILEAQTQGHWGHWNVAIAVAEGGSAALLRSLAAIMHSGSSVGFEVRAGSCYQGERHSALSNARASSSPGNMPSCLR